MTDSKNYYLRPRDQKPKKYKETSDGEDDDDDSDYMMTDEDEELVITITKSEKVPKKKNSEILDNSVLESIPFPICNFEDLYKLAKVCIEEKKNFKDCQKLPNLYPVLEELHNMIGLRSTKDGICNMILFELQNLPSYWRHIVLTGKPGVGKTNVAQIIAKLLNRMGRSSSDEITIGNPLNMISDYEGQTKSEVHNVVQEALSKSGVLLIDEAPTLNDNRKGVRDSYGQKCIDMLMQLMDKHRNDLVVILAGYKDDIERNILQTNAGFRRRIQWFFHLDDYSFTELYEIFIRKMNDAKFQLTPNSYFDLNWFEDHIEDFPDFGGSIESFVHKIKHVQTRKTFGQDEKILIADESIREGYEMYKTYIIEPSKSTKTKSYFQT